MCKHMAPCRTSPWTWLHFANPSTWRKWFWYNQLFFEYTCLFPLRHVLTLLTYKNNIFILSSQSVWYIPKSGGIFVFTLMSLSQPKYVWVHCSSPPPFICNANTLGCQSIKLKRGCFDSFLLTRARRYIFMVTNIIWCI